MPIARVSYNGAFSFDSMRIKDKVLGNGRNIELVSFLFLPRRFRSLPSPLFGMQAATSCSCMHTYIFTRLGPSNEHCVVPQSCISFVSSSGRVASMRVRDLSLAHVCMHGRPSKHKHDTHSVPCNLLQTHAYASPPAPSAYLTVSI